MLARMDSDDVLMAAVAEGDRMAFGRLATSLTGPAIGLASRILGSRADAEDAVQAALMKLWRESGRFDLTRGNVGAWFRRIVVNCALDRRRSIRVVEPIEHAAHVAADTPDPEASAIGADRSARIEAAMAALNPRQRAALALFHGEGQSMREIADALETTPKAVEGLLARARTDLARQLRDLQEITA